MALEALAGSSGLHSSRPVSTSKARSLESLAAAMNTRPPLLSHPTSTSVDKGVMPEYPPWVESRLCLRH
jgi:hypothetical protein